MLRVRDAVPDSGGGNPMKDKEIEEVANLVIAHVESALKQPFGELEQAIESHGHDIEAVAKQAAFLLHQAGVRLPGAQEEPSPNIPDQPWRCEKCGHLLGFFDPGENMLRLRYGGAPVWIVTGAGGRVTVPCTPCGYLNTVEDEPATRE